MGVGAKGCIGGMVCMAFMGASWLHGGSWLYGVNAAAWVAWGAAKPPAAAGLACARRWYRHFHPACTIFSLVVPTPTITITITITNMRTCVPIASQIMDAWNKKYNMARLRFGLDAELDPYQLALAQQTNDKNINEKMRHYLLCLKFRRADGSLHAAGSAFYVMHGFHLAVTAAHVTSMAGTDKIVACYPDGTLSDVIIIGQDPVADISVIKVDRSCPMQNLRHNAPNVGDTVYILGFSSGSDLNFTKGMVTSMEQAAIFTTDAYADNGFSGGPVFNLHMEIVGMVKGGAGYVWEGGWSGLSRDASFAGSRPHPKPLHERVAAHANVQGITNQQVRCMSIGKVEGFVSGIMAVSPGCRSWP